ncbi:hypothetical protein Tco_0309846 [Tanacetum coccineum]
MSDLKFVDTHNLVAFLEKPDEMDGKKVVITETSVRRVLKLKDDEGIDCIPNATIFERLTLMGTPLFHHDGSSSQEEMGEGSAIPTDPYHTHIITQPSTSQPQKKQPRRKQRKDTKDSIKLNELMELYTTLQSRVLALETTKTNQALEINSLKRRVKKLEKKKRSRTHGLKRLYKVGLSAKVISSDDEGLGDQEDASKQGRKIVDIDVDAEVTLIDETQRRNDDNLKFDIGVLDEQEVEVEKVVSTAEVTTYSATTTTVNELTLDQTLREIKVAKPKVRGVMIQEPSEFTTTTTTTTPAASKPSQDKGKAKMTELEKPLKKKDQIMYDQEVALNLQDQLQAKLEEEERLARQKEEEANIALIESWVTTRMDGCLGYQMDSLLNNYKLKNKSRLSIEEKGAFLEYDNSKKQKIDDDQEEAEMKKLIEIVIEDADDITIDAITLATKPPSIVDWNIYKEDKKSYYQFKSTKPVEDLDLMLCWNLKIMFEPLTAGDIWKNQLGNKVIIWKLIDSYRVHFVRMESMHIYMLVDKRYPLKPVILKKMLNKMLQADD